MSAKPPVLELSDSFDVKILGLVVEYYVPCRARKDQVRVAVSYDALAGFLCSASKS